MLYATTIEGRHGEHDREPAHTHTRRRTTHTTRRRHHERASATAIGWASFDADPAIRHAPHPIEGNPGHPSRIFPEAGVVAWFVTVWGGGCLASRLVARCASQLEWCLFWRPRVSDDEPSLEQP